MLTFELQARLKQFYRVWEAKTKAGETSPLTRLECATLEAFVQFVSMMESVEDFNDVFGKFLGPGGGENG